ncbi:uncharacterized protein [Primulina eburnea]|uniref:uncharacterized protein isoform X2 n=1 Tax=Primulina eburnea TaxID=1245227 RepID=UPI003C6C82DC
MAAVNASCVSFTPVSSSSPMLLSSNFTTFPSNFSSRPLSATVKRRILLDSLSAINIERSVCQTVESTGTQLHSFSPLPLLVLAALPGAATVTSVFGPLVELVKLWNLPDWLIHWGHPGNMEEKAKAKALHPNLLGGMFFFFALGATGGITSLLTSDKSIFESPHAVTGFIGLTLLTVQTILPALFEGNPGLRNVHGILGSGIMTLFLVHAALGLQLGLSY